MADRVYTQILTGAVAILERDGKILLVKEHRDDPSDPVHGKWSHPAGLVEVGENPIEAIRREVREEAGYDFEPTAILGVYSFMSKDIQKPGGTFPHYLKVIFLGEFPKEPAHPLLDDVSETKWFTPEEIYAMDQSMLREKDIKDMIKRYFAGTRYPLDLITHTVQE